MATEQSTAINRLPAEDFVRTQNYFDLVGSLVLQSEVNQTSGFEYCQMLGRRLGEYTDPRNAVEAAVSLVRDLKFGVGREHGRVLPGRLVGLADEKYMHLILVFTPGILGLSFGEWFELEYSDLTVQDDQNGRDWLALFESQSPA